MPNFDGEERISCTVLQAYNGLEEEVREHLRQVSVSGTEVSYVDSNFLECKMAGLLEVTVVGATGLRSSDVRVESRHHGMACLCCHALPTPS